MHLIYLDNIGTWWLELVSLFEWFFLGILVLDLVGLGFNKKYGMRI